MEVQSFHVDTIGAKGVNIALTDSSPIDEFNTKFKGRVCCTNKIVFIDAQQSIEVLDMRYRCFAYANRSNRFRFDELNIDVWGLEKACEA